MLSSRHFAVNVLLNLGFQIVLLTHPNEKKFTYDHPDVRVQCAMDGAWDIAVIKAASDYECHFAMAAVTPALKVDWRLPVRARKWLRENETMKVQLPNPSSPAQHWLNMPLP